MAPHYQKADKGAHWRLRHPMGIEATAVRGSSSQDWTVWNVEGGSYKVESADDGMIVNLLKSIMLNAVGKLVEDLKKL
jgi:hypothetical protein